MNALAQQYKDGYGEDAIWRFFEDLMRDDPIHHKRGYSRENAIIATAEAFGLPESEVEKEVKIHE